MAFHFPLEVVLRFRQSVEHQQELRLRAATQHVARVRHLIEQLDQRAKEMQNRQWHELNAGTTAAELRFAFLCQSALSEQRRVLETELVRLQHLRNEQQKIYQKARRERETIASLRDRQQREYRRQAARREQRQLDDLFLLRQSYKSHS